MELAAEMEAAAAAAGSKRKGCVGESEASASSAQLKSRRLIPENSVSSQSTGNLSCETVGPDNASASCCSSNGSSEVTKDASKFVDLEDNEETVEFLATSAQGDSFYCRERREKTEMSEVQAESGELESTAGHRALGTRSLSPAEKMISDAELEEFFAVAEKNLQKKFMDKYNFDIVKDEPLEGRYEWVKVQSKP